MGIKRICKIFILGALVFILCACSACDAIFPGYYPAGGGNVPKIETENPWKAEDPGNPGLPSNPGSDIENPGNPVDDDDTERLFEFYDYGATITVGGLTALGRTQTALEIPSEYKGKPVTAIWHYNVFMDGVMESCFIPASIETVGYSAFAYCYNLQEIVFEEGSCLTEFPDLLFESCTSLRSITIPASVTAIGYEAFKGCSSLEDISFGADTSPVSISNRAFLTTKWYTDLPDGPAYLGNILYSYKGTLPYLSEFTVREGTVSIASYAFYEQRGLRNITLPESLVNIDDNAFRYSGLMDIVLPKNLSSVTAEAFSCCNSLASVEPDRTNIFFKAAGGALYDITGETLVLYPLGMPGDSFMVPEGVKTIGKSAFSDNYYLRSVILPQGLERIDALAFLSARNLSSLTIPENVEHIGYQAFDYSSLSHIFFEGLIPPSFPGAGSNLAIYVIKDSALDAYKQAWDGDAVILPLSALKSDFFIDNGVLVKYFGTDAVVHVPQGVKAIGEYAFYNNRSIESVVLPDGLEEIRGCAFSSSGVGYVDLPDSLRFIGNSAFYFCQSMLSITLPENIEEIGSGIFNACFNLGGITVKGGAGRYYSVDGVLFDRRDKALVCFPAGKGSGYTLIGDAIYFNYTASYTVPEGIEILSDNAFAYASIGEIILPAGLKEIRYSAFLSCSLTQSLIIPDTVRLIGDNVFCGCSSLESIIIPGSVTEIGHYPFQSWTDKQTVYFVCGESAVPKSVFSYCNANFVFGYIPAVTE